jgi:UDP-glucose 4-epimerase
MNPKSEYALAVPAFVDGALNGRPLVIYGDGEQTRDFVFIEDVVNASIYAVESEMHGVYNVGTGIPTSINKLAETISAGKSEIIHEAGRAGEARHNCASIVKLKAAGFSPSWSLEDGLKKVKGAQEQPYGH